MRPGVGEMTSGARKKRNTEPVVRNTEPVVRNTSTGVRNIRAMRQD